jgi:hypothetical protein
MGKISRRSVLRGLVVTGGTTAAAATGAAAQAAPMQTVSGRVNWFNRTRGLLMVEAYSADGLRLLVEVQGSAATPVDLAGQVRLNSPITLVVAPPEDTEPFAPWRVHAVVADGREQLQVDARLVSMAWPGRHRVEDILQVVSAHFGVSVADILSDRGWRLLIRARQTGIYLSHKLTSHSLTDIGRCFGNRDHTVVLHAIRKIDREVAADVNRRNEVEHLQEQVTRLAWKPARAIKAA